MRSYLTVFLASAAVSLLAGYPVHWLALRLGVVDHPERRKMHQIPIPLMGGLAIFTAFFLVSAAALAAAPDLDASEIRAYLGLVAGGLLILLLGIYDDVKGLKAPAKFMGQTLAALVVVSAGAKIDLFTNPLGASVHLGWVGVPLAVFWIVGVTNAVNLIDGLDGLALGIGGIAALGLFAVSVGANSFLATLCIALAGASLGFLRHNFYPARIFLGDSGSMLIGFSLAVIGLLGSYKSSTAAVLFLPIIVLGVPLFDTVFAIFRRAQRRVSPFKADREHIHHRLVRIGLHHRNVVLVLYFVCAYLALTAFSIAQFPAQTAFLFLVLLTMGGIIGLRTLRFIEERLESRLPEAVPATESAGGRAGPSRAGGQRGASEFTSLVCVVGDFKAEALDADRIGGFCRDIESMLSRRVRVHAVVAEPVAPGRLLVVVRTGPLAEPLAALVRDGIAWYMEDQRERVAAGSDFPRISWLPAVGPSDAVPPPADSAPGERTHPGPVRLRQRRAGVVGH